MTNLTQVIDTATDLASERGLWNLNNTSVASRLGCNRTLVTYYLKGESLVDLVIDRALQTKDVDILAQGLIMFLDHPGLAEMPIAERKRIVSEAVDV